LAGPVTFEVGNVTYDGDRSSTGDQLTFNGGSGFVNISDAVNPLNDIFNSTLSYNGVQKTAPFINPAYVNSLGLDADIFIPNNAAKNYIGNSATSATLRLTTGGETYLTQVVTMAIDVYEPDLRAAVRAVDLNGGLVQPGDTLEYTIVGKNIGSDPSVNTFIVDTIERNAIYVPGSLRISSGPNLGNKTDASADDQGEYIAASRTIKVRIGTGANGSTGGTVLNSTFGVDSTQIKFKCTATTDCVVLLCDAIINARAYIYGTGNVSGNTWSNGSNPGIFDVFGCPIPGTTNTPIQAGTCPALAASSNSPVCSGNSINLSLNTTSSGATYSWSGPNGFTSTSSSPSIPNATSSMAGVYTCTISVTGYTCTTVVSTSVTVPPSPTVSNAGTDQSICASAGTATMSANTPVSGTGTWTQVSGPVTAAITTPGSATTTITGMTTAGTYVFQWSIANAPCPASTDQVQVIVNAPPTASNAGPDASVCGLTTTLAGNTPTTGTGTWTLVAGPGTATFVNANLATTNVTVSVAGAYTFRWTIANAPCTASQDNVIITFVSAPTTANAGPDQTICTTGGSATMAGNAPTVGSGTWTQVSGPVTATITTPGSATSTITGMTTAGTYVFQWSIANSPCPSSTDQVQVIVNAPPTVSNAGSAASVCGLTATLAGNIPTVGTGTWTQTAGPGTSTFTNANLGTSDVTVTVAGTYTFTWTITNAPCAASASTVNITFVNAPSAALAGADDTICGLSSTLAGNIPASGIGTWTQVSGPGTTTFTNANLGNTAYSVTVQGVYVYAWTITNAPCPQSSDTVTITLDAQPSASNAGADQLNVCPPSVTMTAVAPVFGTGTWTQIAGPNTANIVTPNSEATSIGALIPGTYTFVWTITNGSCPATTDTVNVVVIGCDSDGDGINDFVDLDDDNDGIPDTVETTADTDGDGIPNSLDLDSDNDGIPDVQEAGGADTNNDGIIDGFTDLNGDGLDDNTATNPLPNPDTDGDGIVNTQDLDSDNDGITDVTEAGGTDANGDGIIDGYTDTDGDGLSDNVDPNNGGTPLPTPDTDGDGHNDYVDLDSDNDGITDVTEAGGTDANGDGIIDGYVDTDGDGLSDNVDTNNGGTMLPNGDQDGDGIPNVLDLDSDNDGITDVTEAGGTDANGDGIIDGFADTDNDGLSDNVDPNNGGTPLPTPDTDGDGLDNYLDVDSDNDGITDVTEAGGIDANNDGIIDGYVDTDNDGLSDNVDTNNGGTMLAVGDFDNDGIENYLDLDSDNDGIVDVIEAGGVDGDNDGIIGTGPVVDTDGDGLSDVVDTDNGGTALPVPNTDATGGANYLDIDADNDGIVDNIEGQPTASYVAPTGVDTDGDGIDDAYDTIVGFGGAGVTPTNTDGADTPDYIDLDSDNDTAPDTTEGWDTNNDGVADTLPSGNDSDNDGLDDAYDADGTSTTNAGGSNNGGDLPTDFPDLDNVGADRDWRDPLDTDGDGISNVNDLDDDNDGIPDTLEASGDTDGDGIPDTLDLDSDNDGIPDVTEAGGTDLDGDGIIDGFTDTNGDGLDDNTAANPLPNGDTDGDGLPDAIDLDSDNDGIPDVTEAGGTDLNGDGIIDGYVDTDGDGLSDNVDPNNGGTPLPNPDTDGDGVNDVLDLDSDNDGITDVTEAGGTDANGDGIIDGYTDTDGDGLSDNVDTNNGGTALPTPDTDGDGINDMLDLDSDNDGITDVVEAGGTDANGDGIIDGNVDTDGDGLSDNVDPNNGGTALPIPDTDNDGNVNYLDIDADNDGIVDNIEAQTTAGYVAPTGLDTDGDGIDNAYDADNGGTPIVLTNTDGADNPDYLDLDSDNDGMSDLLEGWDTNNDGVADTTPSGNDSDNDGLDDAFDVDGTSTTNAGGATNGGDLPTDFPDLDNVGGDRDWRDGIDNDNDGIDDIVDLDDDNDGIPDTFEASGDTDGDGIPDSLDLDSDNDGIADIIEAGGTDANGDGLVDNFVDTNNDGLDDNIAANPIGNPDSDGDGIPNTTDLDSDNDGILDVIEAGGTDANGDGLLDGYVDTDGDGWNDNADPNAGGTLLPTPDTDSDGNMNFLDIDADNDGIVDNVEGQSTGGYTPPTGTDTDGDGIDDAYDIDNGGTPINPVNTDGTDNPDYLDLDSDNDGDSDAVEAWDTNNDGDPEITPTGNDSDGDGLDDAYDVDGTSTTNNGGATNGGTTPNSFPDLDNPGGDRDWREIIGTELEIPTGFSPNGDGVNDFFEIVGIGNYPDNKVTIFNRWGNLVYEAAGYDNGSVRWNGENTGNLSVGSGPVPEGTYFYVIDLGDGSAVLSGYVFLNRQ
jgi:gliding motility-associated-like protein